MLEGYYVFFHTFKVWVYMIFYKNYHHGKKHVWFKKHTLRVKDMYDFFSKHALGIKGIYAFFKTR